MMPLTTLQEEKTLGGEIQEEKQQKEVEEEEESDKPVPGSSSKKRKIGQNSKRMIKLKAKLKLMNYKDLVEKT